MSYEVFLCKKENFSPGFEIELENEDHFQLHFISGGKGIVHSSGRYFSLSHGQCFVVFPQTSFRCRADDKSPWSIFSITFTGPGIAEDLVSLRLTPDSPVLDCDDTCRAFYYIEEIIGNQNDSPGAHWRVKGNLLKIIGELERFALAEQTPIPFDHVRKAILYMERNYTQPISVADIVTHVCLERSYFSHLFKERTGDSPKDFLNKYRMDKAMELILASSGTIESIARSVGYLDPLHFSRNFKVYSGYAPTAYRSRGNGKSNES